MLHWQGCAINQRVKDTCLHLILIRDEIQGKICLTVKVYEQDFLAHTCHASPDGGCRGGLRNAIRYLNVEDTSKLVVAPADGKIVVIEEVENAPYFGDRRLMISIFMSLWNVHANWFPVDGKVKFVKHVDGNYHKAWLPKASEENEHADVMITTPEGVDVLCRQIAGAVARRIVTYAKEGEECFIDEHLGFIKLGSRVDVYLPVGTEVCVKMGQSTTGDQTIIAKLK